MTVKTQKALEIFEHFRNMTSNLLSCKMYVVAESPEPMS